MILTISDRKTRRRVEFFNSFKLNLRYDSVGSTFSFSFYYNPKNEDHKALAAVGQYQLARLEYNDELLLTGFILSQGFTNGPQGELLSFAGYSVPGVLEDSQIPPSAYPLQSDGLSLRQIAEKLMRPFQIKIEVDPDVSSEMDKVYEKTTADAGASVKDYLVELATQRNIIVSHTANGRLLFTRAKTNQKPFLKFGDGLIGATYSLSFNGQGMHNEITVLKQADSDGGNASQFTIKNPYVPESTTAFRPKVIIQNSGDDNDTAKAARAALASELKNIQLKISTDRWDVNGRIIKPNSIISIISPQLYLFKETNFFVEEVEYSGDSTKLVSNLSCVPPEAYSNSEVKNIFL